MYKCMLNSVVKISMMSVKYFENYTIILRGGPFFRGHAVFVAYRHMVWFSRVTKVSRVTVGVSVRIRVTFGFIGPPYH